MEEHEVFIAALFNRYVAEPIAVLFGYHPSGHAAVVPAHVVMILFVCLVLILVSIPIRRRFDVENPGHLQQTLELLIEGIMGFMRDIVGPRHREFFPIVGALFFFILFSNLLGLLPGFMSPTSNINVTAGCAIVVFFYYNIQGIKCHGFLRYMAHFAGPSLFLAPMLFVIEIISHMARPFSLGVRLFGNIFAEELIISTLNHIFPFLITLPVMALALFASTVQAFIFIVLTMVYVGGAVEGAHHDEPQESELEGQETL